MIFTIYSKASGRVLFCVECDEAAAALHAGDEDDLMPGRYDPSEFYFNGSTPVAMPPRPSEHHEFNYTTKQWEDPRTLTDLKAAKNQAINMARAAANSSFFMFQGKRIAVDQLSRSDIDAAHGSILMLQALPPGWPGGWKSMDNEIVLIPDVATWAQFYGTMVATGTANFNHSQALKAQLAAASTPAEVDAVPEW